MSTPRPIALITGGASGIGASTAEQWVAAGGVVAVIDLDEAAVEKAVAALGADNAIGRAADVASAEAVTAAVQSFGETFGRIDAVVNCAGIAGTISAEHGSDEDWARMIDVNLNGTMRVCRSAAEFLQQSERAAIVNISSVSGTNGLPGRTSYSASKAGIEGLTRSLAVEWAPRIRVNTVCPGYTRTAMVDYLVAEHGMKTEPIENRTPLRRFADPSEIAAAINFLASPAASFITGTSLRVDGGISIDGNWYD